MLWPVQILIAAIALLAAGTFADKASEPPKPIAEASIHNYGDVDKSCVAWSDGCRNCGRGSAAGNSPFCNNIGIACQPRAILCTERRNGSGGK